MRFRVLTKTVLYRTYEVEAGNQDQAEALVHDMTETRAARTAEEVVMSSEMTENGRSWLEVAKDVV